MEFHKYDGIPQIMERNPRRVGLARSAKLENREQRELGDHFERNCSGHRVYIPLALAFAREEEAKNARMRQAERPVAETIRTSVVLYTRKI